MVDVRALFNHLMLFMLFAYLLIPIIEKWTVHELIQHSSAHADVLFHSLLCYRVY